MKEFHVLPTDPNFQALSSEQLDFIVASLEQDNREMKLAASGREEESYVNDNDFDFYSDKFEYGGKKDVQVLITLLVKKLLKVLKYSLNRIQLLVRCSTLVKTMTSILCNTYIIHE